MFILDEPYVSDLLYNTIQKGNYAVLENEFITKHKPFHKNILDKNEAINYYKDKNMIYTNSENSINWIANNLFFSDLPKNINAFKNKYLFRQTIQEMYPEFYFKELSIDELIKLDYRSFNKPFVIKPSVGFLSLGVYTIFNQNDWIRAIQCIIGDVKKIENMFSKDVIDATKFLIEERIEGTEYAIDAYVDSDGSPVILNILKHVFSSDLDVSDRLYITSKNIIKQHIKIFHEFLSKITALFKIKNFPMHVELRLNKNSIIPIEVNPMRFAGWCSTDIAYFAYGINPYTFFMENIKPDWENILKEKGDEIYSIIVLNTPKDFRVNNISGFNYNKLCSQFEKVLELRKVDFHKYPLFGFVFTRTEKLFAELENILKSDLTEFLF